MYYKAQLTKNWKVRVWWWIAGAIAVIILLHEEPVVIPPFLVGFIIIDEKLKEGYFFKPSDLKKPLTHEFLTALTVITIVILDLLKRRWEYGERRKP